MLRRGMMIDEIKGNEIFCEVNSLYIYFFLIFLGYLKYIFIVL